MAHHGEMLCKRLPFKRYHWFYACCIAVVYAAPSSTQWLTTLLNKFPSFRYMGALPRLWKVAKQVSERNVRYYKADEMIFHSAVDALFRKEMYIWKRT